MTGKLALLATRERRAGRSGGGAGEALLRLDTRTEDRRDRGQQHGAEHAPLDGCPIQSPDGLSLYMASNRPGGHGPAGHLGRAPGEPHAPWGAPENLGDPVNSAADDFCPTPVRGGGLFFVSREAPPGSCGLGDIYFTRRTRKTAGASRTTSAARRTGPTARSTSKARPTWRPTSRRPVLLAQLSDRPRRHLRQRAARRRSFGPASAVAELNSPAANDIQPNVRKDGREVVLSSNPTGAQGGQDL